MVLGISMTVVRFGAIFGLELHVEQPHKKGHQYQEHRQKTFPEQF
jgi:hypothetical protein